MPVQLGNYDLAIFLINDDVRMLGVRYEPTKEEGGERDQPIRYVKTMDQAIKKDDIVIVPSNSRWKFTTVKVVDDQVEPDLNSRDEVPWVVGKVDFAEYENFKGLEKQATDMIKDSQRRKAKEELREQMFDQKAKEGLKAIGLASSSILVTSGETEPTQDTSDTTS